MKKETCREKRRSQGCVEVPESRHGKFLIKNWDDASGVCLDVISTSAQRM